MSRVRGKELLFAALVGALFGVLGYYTTRRVAIRLAVYE